MARKQLVVNCTTGATEEVDVTPAEEAYLATLMPAERPEPRDPQIAVALAEGQAAIAEATTLDEVKAAFAATLDGLASIFGGGS